MARPSSHRLREFAAAYLVDRFRCRLAHNLLGKSVCENEHLVCLIKHWATEYETQWDRGKVGIELPQRVAAPARNLALFNYYGCEFPFGAAEKSLNNQFPSR